MTTSTRRSYPAMALGALFALGTGVVLLEDIVHGAPVTTAHLLTVLAIVGVIAAGHLAGPYLAGRQIGAGLGLATLFVAGTAYLVVASGSRNAEHQSVRVAQIEKRNAERAALDQMVAAAKKRHEEAQDAFAKECGTGRGTKCEGRKAVVEALHDGIYMAMARRDMAGPVERPLAGYAHTADLFSALSGVPAAKIEKTLSLVMPFTLVLITELGCLVFWSIGLGKQAPIVVEWPQPEPQKLLAVDVPIVIDERQTLLEQAREWHRRFHDLNGRAPSWPEQRAAFPTIPKTTAHKIRVEALA